jgi:DNA-binding GntR family transcriptional regulator
MTIQAVEEAIEKLSPEDVAKLATWLEEYQARVAATAETFAMYDREEAGLCKQNGAKSGK